jgi:putative PIN family toxin of toxin-antitoxin system
MKIVIDTNCLLQVLPKQSPYRCLWDAFLNDRFALCYTTDMLQEYEEILSDFYSPRISEYMVGSLVKSKSGIPVIPYFRWNLITADPDDNKFVDCALNVGADYIVTNDRHFNVLKTLGFPPITVVNIETFKKILIYKP